MLGESEVGTVVSSLITARKNRAPIEFLPYSTQAWTLDDAYRVQQAFADSWFSPIAGYKIGAASEASQRLISAPKPFVARIFRDDCYDSPVKLNAGTFFQPAVEAELAFRLSEQVPAKDEGYERGEIEALIGAVHPVIEICDNRFVDWRTVGYQQIIADNGFFGGLVVGTSRVDWRDFELEKTEAAVQIDGRERSRGICCEKLGDPVDKLVWAINELSKLGISVAANSIVSVGTWTGLHPVSATSRVRADLRNLGTVEIEFL